jgi:hypothetical protein
MDKLLDGFGSNSCEILSLVLAHLGQSSCWFGTWSLSRFGTRLWGDDIIQPSVKTCVELILISPTGSGGTY